MDILHIVFDVNSFPPSDILCKEKMKRCTELKCTEDDDVSSNIFHVQASFAVTLLLANKIDKEGETTCWADLIRVPKSSHQILHEPHILPKLFLVASHIFND